MANWVQLTRKNGDPVWVNLDQACMVKRSAENSYIRFPGTDDNSVAVSETLEEIASLIDRE